MGLAKFTLAFTLTFGILPMIAPGKRYYFRAQIDDRAYYVDLQPVSEDEGRLMVSQAARSISRSKP